MSLQNVQRKRRRLHEVLEVYVAAYALDILDFDECVTCLGPSLLELEALPDTRPAPMPPRQRLLSSTPGFVRDMTGFFREDILRIAEATGLGATSIHRTGSRDAGNGAEFLFIFLVR